MIRKASVSRSMTPDIDYPSGAEGALRVVEDEFPADAVVQAPLLLDSKRSPVPSTQSTGLRTSKDRSSSAGRPAGTGAHSPSGTAESFVFNPDKRILRTVHRVAPYASSVTNEIGSWDRSDIPQDLASAADLIWLRSKLP